MTFRIFANDLGQAIPGGIHFDNVVINGSVQSVPEPASMIAWLGMASVGGLVSYRRRKLAK